MYRMVRSILEGKQDILPPDSEDILSGKRGMMCQYDKALHFETLWSVIYALGTLGIQRVEGSPRRKQYRSDQRLNWALSKK
jgi:predicted choloylglycine hydrolase